MRSITSGELAGSFRSRFNSEPQIFRAPGRVNLIGEHTDYNEGFVLPSAIGFYTRVAISPRSDTALHLASTEFRESFEFDVQNLPPKKVHAWCDYVLGVAAGLKNSGIALHGANLLVHGEVPIGAGLSSSAALEVASALAFLSLSGKALPLEAVAKLCRKAENEFVGARVGIMDQFISCFGQVDHAVMLDCRALDHQLIPIPRDIQFVICNTKVKHELSTGEYNRRREECEQAVKFLAANYPQIRSLRDVSPQQLSAVATKMPATLCKRSTHVISENRRVLRAAECFRSGDLRTLGELMRDSHRSLRDDYEVSCRELDVMVKAAEGLPGFIGGRMTGGGFGGCTVNLVERRHALDFASQLAERYRSATGITPDVFVCSAVNGAGMENTDSAP